jgi:membrane-associated phospholipid phosphatase
MKKLNTPIAILLAIWVVLAIIFAFTDLQISQGIYNPNSGWAHLFEAYGQIPGGLVAFSCGALLLRLYKLEKKFWSIIKLIGLYLVTYLAAAMPLMDLFGAQEKAHLNMPLIFGLALVLLLLVRLVLGRIPAEKLAQLKPAAKVGLTLMFVAGILTVWAFKIPWGRWTYRDMISEGNISLFTPWYLPQGINGHNSFFSGHSAMFLSVLPVILFFKKQATGRKVALVLVLLWGTVGALSRVVIGAHFASDVLFGAGETILWFLLLSKWFKADI